jgi:glutaminase A-like protein
MQVFRWPRDNLFVNNQTNLAIKGIIAIEAMSKMSSVINQAADVNKYSVCTGHLYGMRRQ